MAKSQFSSSLEISNKGDSWCSDF